MTSPSEQTTALIAEAREAVAYLDMFDAYRKNGGSLPAMPASLADRMVQGTIADLADALEAATSGTEWAYLNDDGQTAKYGPYVQPPRPAGGFVIGHRSVGPWVGGTE